MGKPRVTQQSIVKFANGIELPLGISNVHDTAPTEAQVIAEFGAIADHEPGLVGVLKDADADTNAFIVFCTGTKYVTIKGTIAA